MPEVEEKGMSCMRVAAPKRMLAGAVLAVVWMGGFALGQSAPAPSIEGRWSGVAGFPQDRVEIGIEFRRDANGDLAAYLYQPVMNFYGLRLGVVTVQDGRFVLADAALDVAFAGERLEGTYFPLKAPIVLERTDRLPSEVPIPEFPAGPAPVWHTKLGGAIYAAAAVRDGIAYLGTTGGMFSAIRLADGGFVWSFAAGRPIFGTASVTEDHVYFVCDNGYLYKLQRDTGKEAWRYDLGDGRVGRVLEHQVVPNSGEFDFDHGAPQPAIAGGVVYVGSGDGGFHAVDATTGTRLWRFEGKGKIRTDAVLLADRVVIGTLDGIVFAIARDSGRELWRKETHAAITGAPALVAGRIIVGNRGGLIAALDPATGSLTWRMLLWGSAVESSAAPTDGSQFCIGSSDLRRVSLMDSADGKVLWRTDVYGWAWARPAVVGSTVYCSVIGTSPYEIRHVGSLTALDRTTGRVVWRVAMPSCDGSLLSGFAATPVVDGDRLLVGGLDGTLYAFGLRPAESPTRQGAR